MKKKNTKKSILLKKKSFKRIERKKLAMAEEQEGRIQKGKWRKWK